MKWIIKMQTIRKDIKASQDLQKHYADAKQSVIRTFEQGDMVFLRVRPKRSSISLGKYKNLSPRYCGPYVITRKVGDQAYKLLLPPQLKVHNVFHISLLKKYVPDPSHILLRLQARVQLVQLEDSTWVCQTCLLH